MGNTNKGRIVLLLFILLPGCAANQSSLTYKDGGAYGRVTSITEDFGNLVTEISPAAMQTLGITRKAYFQMKFKNKAYKVYWGKDYGDVPKGKWIAVEREDRIRLARNLENAAKTLNCKVGDQVFIAPWPGDAGFRPAQE